MTGLLHAPYAPGQMTYDLRRLRLAGLIRRIERTNTYVLTPTACRLAARRRESGGAAAALSQ
jgi:hypothetical protein